MAQTTGPVIAMGAITMANQSILNKQPIDWRVPIATGFLAMGFALLEKGNAKVATGIAWIAILTVTLARVDPKIPSPAETLVKLWEKK